MKNCKRTSNQHAGSESAMQQAILSLINSDQGYENAAKVFSVPQITLERRVNIFQKNLILKKRVKRVQMINHLFTV